MGYPAPSLVYTSSHSKNENTATMTKNVSTAAFIISPPPDARWAATLPALDMRPVCVDWMNTLPGPAAARVPRADAYIAGQNVEKPTGSTETKKRQPRCSLAFG